MNNIKKIFIISILVLIFANSYSFAFDIGNVVSGATGFMSGVNSEVASSNVDTGISPLISGLSTAAMAIGTIVVVVGGIIIGIKFMTDSSEGKAEFKQALTPYLIGCTVIFGAYGIWRIVVEIMQGTF